MLMNEWVNPDNGFKADEEHSKGNMNSKNWEIIMLMEKRR